MNFPLFLFGLSVLVVGFLVALKLRKWHFSQKKSRPRPLKVVKSVHEESENFEKTEFPEESDSYEDSSDSDLLEFDLDKDEK